MSFFWQCRCRNTTAGGAKGCYASEAAFQPMSRQGNQIVFTHPRSPASGSCEEGKYRFIHPYGEETAWHGRRANLFTDDVGIGAPGDFIGAMKQGASALPCPIAHPLVLRKFRQSPARFPE
jgi:hypothetical protein